MSLPKLSEDNSPMSASMIEHMDASMKNNEIGGGKV